MQHRPGRRRTPHDSGGADSARGGVGQSSPGQGSPLAPGRYSIRPVRLPSCSAPPIGSVRSMFT
eukprot:13346939-Alexandrium_andersonii.AAC.1